MMDTADFKGDQQPSVGILGGGQLACMLGTALQKLGIEPLFLVDDPLAPARHLFTRTAFAPSLRDVAALKEFLEKVQIVAFENEFVNCDLLRQTSRDTSVRFLPALDCIELLQDKLRQKELLNRLQVPTAPHIPLDLTKSFEDALRSATNNFGGACVLKWSRMGYDGKGVMVLEQKDFDDPKRLQLAIGFCELGLSRGGIIYAESRIRFRRELALIACKSVSGEFLSYPLVITEQENGICKTTIGPAQNAGISKDLEILARESAKKVADGVDLVGAFALEFFETESGELLVNEIAPRVHNSGHYTMDAAETSQFENHWRALLGLPLGSTQCTAGFAMLNLLGPSGIIVRDAQKAGPKSGDGYHVHWYEKSEIRPGRKVGHVNATSDSTKDTVQLIRQLQEVETNWIESLKKKNPQENAI